MSDAVILMQGDGHRGGLISPIVSKDHDSLQKKFKKAGGKK